MKENKEGTPSEAMRTVHPKVLRRASALMILAVILFGLLLVRILLLQTLGFERYQKKVIEQMTTESNVAAERGNIYDANGVMLATNVTTYRVFISPSSIAAAKSESVQSGAPVEFDVLIAENLSKLLGVEYDFVYRQTTHTRYLDRTIKKEVDEGTADRVRAFIAEYGLQRMIYLETTNTRYYPYSTLASHVLGFTGSDGTGLYGLEYYYNEMLAGTNGKYITARDAQGNEMPYSHKEYIAAQDGYHVNTTIDLYVQSALEEQVERAYTEAGGENRAAGIVMDVNTGAILGMATYPYFNLNDPWELDYQSSAALAASGYEAGSDEYAKLKQQLLLEMWSNKAITESYIPGSTFKVITASMALEEAVVTTDQCFVCKGSKLVSGHNIHCHKTTGHGQLTFTQGIQQSCNPVLMTVGEALGRENFYQYLNSFGYLGKTGIDLPGEGIGVFASKENFTDLDLAIYAFGQNFNVTLIQQITAISAVANGGYLVKPHMVSSITDHDGNVIRSYGTNVSRQVVSSEVCKTVSSILEGGVSGNGGAKNAYVAGYRVAAKTGTSEKKNAGSIGSYVCSTVAYAPADNPQYAVIIIVDEPTSGVLYGSTVAAPYVGNVMETILPYLGVEAIYSEEELQRLTVTVPNCIRRDGSYAQSLCEGSRYGLTVDFVGDPAGVVVKQYPEAGTIVEKNGGRIILYTDRDAETLTVKVPDLTGMTAVAANQKLINDGFNIRIAGTKNYHVNGVSATVIAQNVAPGTELPKGSVIEVTFRYLDDEDYTENELPPQPQQN
ncbi:MAG: PASTA domain-containing protein [Clostridia bacterium]|nr:PASTA domain-containing protein [Clostridia bacterium]